MLMKTSTMTKFVICIAVVSVAITICTQSLFSSIIDYRTAKNNAMYSGQVANNNSGNSGSNNSSSGGGYTPTTPGGSTSSGSDSSSQSTQTNNNSGSTDSGDKAPVADNNSGSEDAGAAQGDGLKMYVDALNKAKTSAAKVTRVRTNASNYKGHVKAGMLSSIAKSLMGTFMKEDTTPVEKDKNELPPNGLSCNLDASAVQSVDVQKDGDKTIVTIVTIAESNPKAGSGIGSAVSIIEEKTITDAVAGVIEISNIKLDYDPCTLKATIDADGNLVALYVQAPCILSLTAMGIDAEVGIDCEDEFVIEY